jgi:hypothetical protein
MRSHLGFSARHLPQGPCLPAVEQVACILSPRVLLVMAVMWTRQSCVFMWQGSGAPVNSESLFPCRFAQQKRALIDAKKHQILAAAHPSGFSANKVASY